MTCFVVIKDENQVTKVQSGFSVVTTCSPSKFKTWKGQSPRAQRSHTVLSTAGYVLFPVEFLGKTGKTI